MIIVAYSRRTVFADDVPFGGELVSGCAAAIPTSSGTAVNRRIAGM
jgi:hypothetical protein